MPELLKYLSQLHPFTVPKPRHKMIKVPKPKLQVCYFFSLNNVNPFPVPINFLSGLLIIELKEAGWSNFQQVAKFLSLFETPTSTWARINPQQQQKTDWTQYFLRRNHQVEEFLELIPLTFANFLSSFLTWLMSLWISELPRLYLDRARYSKGWALAEGLKTRKWSAKLAQSSARWYSCFSNRKTPRPLHLQASFWGVK